MFKNQISVSVDKNKIKELLTRGVEDVFVLENLERKLSSGKQLRVKLGFDPTGSKIHIGRAIVLRKLREAAARFRASGKLVIIREIIRKRKNRGGGNP